MTRNYSELFPFLAFDEPSPGVLEITIRDDRSLNSINPSLHYDLTHVWPALNQDPEIMAIIMRGYGGTFSSGGNFDMIAHIARDNHEQVRMMRETLTQIYNYINFQKPVVSAIEGSASGAGLCLALLADISIAGRGAQLIDPHTRLGVPAGDHAAMIWPILCGLAKAKYHVFTCEPISGVEAERIGLVSVCVEDELVIERARAVAEELTHRSQYALQWTKYHDEQLVTPCRTNIRFVLGPRDARFRRTRAGGGCRGASV